MPVGHLVTAVFYRLQARRHAVAHCGRAYVLTGLVFFVLPCRIGRPVHGLTLVIATALPLFVLAWTERSWALLAFAVPFLAMTVLANVRYAAMSCTGSDSVPTVPPAPMSDTATR